LTPVVEQRTSLFGLSSPRSITVECPSGSWVFAVGGQIIGNNGSVLMTRMSPSDDLRSAIVEAKVRGNPTVPFAVTAYAVCVLGVQRPSLVVETVDQSSTVSARCPDRTVLTGFGYALDRSVDTWRVDAVVPDPALQQVMLHAGGGGTPGSLTAVGICYEVHTDPTQAPPHRADAISNVDGTWPQSVSTPSDTGLTFGVGASVTAPGEVHIDALVPLTRDVGGARATRANGTAAAAQVQRTGDGDDGSVSTFGVRIGTFH
jgi:hypothetical protein